MPVTVASPGIPGRLDGPEIGQVIGPGPEARALNGPGPGAESESLARLAAGRGSAARPGGHDASCILVGSLGRLRPGPTALLDR